MSWRDRARPIVAAVIKRVGTSDVKALRLALRAAYPFGSRSMHPYKIWCDEIRRQLGLKKVADRKSMPQVVPPAAGQRSLFDGGDE